MRALQGSVHRPVDRPKPWFLAIVRNAAMTLMARNRPQDRGLRRRHDRPRRARLASGRRRAPDPEQALIAIARRRAPASGDRQPALALSRHARHARRQRPLLPRHRRSDRGADRHGDVAPRPRPRDARQDLEGRAMTDRDTDERLLRLNAALDGELDAMASLALRARDARRPGARRRIPAPRGAARRDPSPRPARGGAAGARRPHRGADCVGSTARPDGGAGRDGRCAPARARGSTARARARRLLRRARLCRRRGRLRRCGRLGALGDVAQNLVSDFARAAIAGQPFDVASSDRHTVKPWLAGRTTVSASIVDLAPEGFPLAGGRVAIVDRIPGADARLPPQRAPCRRHRTAARRSGRRAPASAIETIDGYHVARWSDANLAYVAVSDMDEKAFADFVAAFQRGRAPAAAPSRP